MGWGGGGMEESRRAMHCRLCINCYGGGGGGYLLPPRPHHTHSLAGSVTINRKTTVHCSLVAKFIVPDWGDLVDSGIALSYRAARLYYSALFSISQTHSP